MCYVRRRTLWEFVRPANEWFVHQEWAGLTFPLVATSTVALFWGRRATKLDGGGDVWPMALAFFCVAVVCPINLLFFARLPFWIAKGLPPVPPAPTAVVPARYVASATSAVRGESQAPAVAAQKEINGSTFTALELDEGKGSSNC